MSDIPNLSYDDLLQLIARQYNTNVDNVVDILNKYNVPPGDFKETFKLLNNTPYKIWYNSDGTVRSTVYNATGSAENTASDIAASLNSNTTTTKTSFNIPISSTVEKTSETASKINFKAGLNKTGKFVIGDVVPAVCAAATGITLGKTIDSLLYKSNPDFWNEHGMSTLNPDTWSSITSGDNSAGATLFNFIYGIDADTNTTQAYMDENALAYMSLYLQNSGVFAKSHRESYGNIKINDVDYAITTPVYSLETNNVNIPFQNGSVSNVIINSKDPVYMFMLKDPITNYYFVTSDTNATQVITGVGHLTDDIFKVNNIKYKIFDGPAGSGFTQIIPASSIQKNINIFDRKSINVAIAVLFGEVNVVGGVDGIGTQSDATVPDLSGIESTNDALQTLKEQYPELWENAVTQEVAQPDGTTKTYTYVPVAVPDIDENGNPVSSTSTQKNPSVTPSSDNEPLIKTLIKYITTTPPVNPPVTGGGDTPVVPPVTGSASSLYAIYNPTLSQINSFGAWLWSNDFVDQIKKLFNDPMQAIIGLHKVYAIPATGGSQTIKVGYLDSGVSSRIVSNQYTTIDCGSVALTEYYNNVFDYSPYTQVQLYLPFIGIVSLDVADVMRSAIHIVYHVDVLTGACLAEVKVIRDGYGGTLYQYAGNAAVTLPISSGSYMGIVASIASIAGGVAGTIASGGAALPMLASAAGSALNARTRVEHSGSFSGNAGAMGSKIPYLIISRPQTALAQNFQNYIGYPSNSTVTLSSCNGYTKVKEIHLENIHATNDELADIESKLKGGVII